MMEEVKDRESESQQPLVCVVEEPSNDVSTGKERSPKTLQTKVHLKDEREPSSAESTPGSPDRATGKRVLKPTDKSRKKLQFDSNEKDKAKEQEPPIHPGTAEDSEGISNADDSSTNEGTECSTQSKPETGEVSEPETKNAEKPGSDEEINDSEVPPPLDFPLAVSQNSAKERADKLVAKGNEISVKEDDATNSGAFLSIIFTDQLLERERKGIDEGKWKKMKKLMEHIIRSYPKSFNRLRDVSEMYDVNRTYSILKKGGIIHSKYELKEDKLVKQHGVFTDDGENALMKAVSRLAEKCSLSIAIYSCGDVTFTIGYQCNHFFVIDTYPVGEELGGNGNGLLKVFSTSNHDDKTSTSLCTWIWERLEQREGPEKEKKQSFSLMSFVPSEIPQDKHVQETWEDYFMHLAFAVSLRSKDKMCRVGCVFIESETLQVLSVGYNGYTGGILTEEAEKEKKDFIVHAEANAIILKGHRSLKGAYAFVTLFPCLPCAVKLIQARIKRIYFLSLTTNDSTTKSWRLLEKAEVELIPYPRGKDGKLQGKFKETLISRISRVHQHILADLETKKGNSIYKELTKEDNTDQFRSKWQTGLPAEILKSSEALRLWEHWFMLIAMTASMKSTRPERPEGCILVDTEEFKMCGMSYRGFPRGIEKDDPDLKDFIEETEVSAITNAISLKFKEGSQYYCFATHFPDVNDAKYLAQAGVTYLFFICPAYTPPHIDKHAMKIFEKANITVVPMTGLHEGWLKMVSDRITETVQKLDKNENKSGNPPFTWPTPDTFSGIAKTDEDAPLTLVYPLILGGKGGLKPLR